LGVHVHVVDAGETRGGVVGGAVIGHDEGELTRFGGERRADLVDEAADAFLLIEGGHHDDKTADRQEGPRWVDAASPRRTTILGESWISALVCVGSRESALAFLSSVGSAR